jgi:two-component system phosphate regulon sensor histidine kinase PhoR
LHSAVSNLVSNAVRYSPEGGTIRLLWEVRDDGARLTIEDEGIGIPNEHLSRLTERFYRVDLARARVKGGTGLGLAIVKHVLKRHNATLQIESILGEGSRFCCRFPANRLESLTPQTQSVQGEA